MRIIVFSDTHNNFHSMKEIFDRNQDVSVFIFLGDGERELRKIKTLYPDKRILNVRGNCDFSDSPLVGTYSYKNIKIVYTHGHRYNVKYTTDTLYYLAMENNAHIVCFGHTHCRHYEYANGIHMLNPGSASEPRDGNPPGYAFIDITDAGIMCSHVDLVKSPNKNDVLNFSSF